MSTHRMSLTQIRQMNRASIGIKTFYRYSVEYSHANGCGNSFVVAENEREARKRFALVSGASIDRVTALGEVPEEKE